MPLLAQQLGQKFFDEKLASLCMSWLGDTVFSIREASVQNLKKLTEVFGVEWATEAIVPKVVAMGGHPNYLYRMTTCFAISVSSSALVPVITFTDNRQTLAPALSLPVIAEQILPILNNLTADQIPNIRFNVAKSYAALIDALKRLPNSTETVSQLEKKGETGSGSERGEALIREQIMPNLDKLMNDDDVDVRFFAGTAAKSWNDSMQT